METTAKLYSLNLSNSRTYLFTLLFVVGNLVFPQLCHLTPYGGPTLLPIYFFTLIASYKYGLRVGLLTALFSPIANSLLFGMPPVAVLPIILIKSGLLAVTAAAAAHYSKKISLGAILIAILGYQLIGTAIEWAIVGDFYDAAQDFRMGIPGMLIQLFGGYALLKAIAKI
nr:ECF transporter S component [uncultured Bacteroides sp.]